jgi:hypothetical protein
MSPRANHLFGISRFDAADGDPVTDYDPPRPTRNEIPSMPAPAAPHPPSQNMLTAPLGLMVRTVTLVLKLSAPGRSRILLGR